MHESAAVYYRMCFDKKLIPNGSTQDSRYLSEVIYDVIQNNVHSSNAQDRRCTVYYVF